MKVSPSLDISRFPAYCMTFRPPLGRVYVWIVCCLIRLVFNTSKTSFPLSPSHLSLPFDTFSSLRGLLADDVKAHPGI